MTWLEPQAAVLGRLLVIQETLDVLPLPDGIASFLDAALAEVPGVEGAHLYVDDRLSPAYGELEQHCRECCATPDTLDIGPCRTNDRLFVYPLRIAVRFYGVLVLRLSDPAEFNNYRDFLGNIANVVARTLESRALLAQLGESNRALEQRIAERTRELSERTVELRAECDRRRTAQEALAESEEKFRQISTAALDAIVISDDTGHVAYWNPAAERMFGYSSHEILGCELHQVLAPSRTQRLSEFGLARFRQSGTGAAIGRIIEWSAFHKDGREFPVELSVSSVRLQGHWNAVGVIRDISERKHSAAAHARLAAIVESSGDAIIAKTLAGIITSWNKGAERIYVYHADEIVGRSVLCLVPPELQEETHRYLEAVAAGKTMRNLETERIRKDGARIDVSLTISPIRAADGTLIGASTIARDIGELKRSELALRRLNRTLKTLTGCNGVLVRAHDETELLREMCKIIVKVGGYGTAWVAVLPAGSDSDDSPLVYHGEGGGFLNIESRLSERKVFDALLRSLMGSGVRCMLHEVAVDSPLFPLRDHALDLGFGAVALVPVRGGSNLVGLFALYTDSPDAFDNDEMALLDELASDMGYGIAHLRDQAERFRSSDRLARSLEQTIQAVATTLEMRDPYTAGHQRRVANLAEAIARKMGLPEDEIRGIRLVALVHDLGKICIPAEILTKPGRLTALEFEFIKTHPQVGYDILKDVEFPWPIAEMVLQHHERLDGTGYPRGLVGDAILPGARIVAVADVVEAMSSHRPYRPGLGIDAAVAELHDHRNSWYDKRVVDACIGLIVDGAYPLQ